MGISTLFLLQNALLTFLLRESLAFSPLSLSEIVPSSRETKLRSSERDDEIARLEEQLRKLKEEQQQKEEGDDEVVPPDAAEVSETALSATSPSSPASSVFEKISAEQQQSKIFVDRQGILSEQEVVDLTGDNTNSESLGSNTEDGGGGFLQVAVGVLALVGLIAFAQVPIGQENLAKYSATGSSSVKGQIDLGDMNMDVKRQQNQLLDF